VSYWLHEHAEAELGDAGVYYAEHANRSIAEALLDEFARVVAVLESNQLLGTLKDDGIRVYPFRRFPYSLVYRADNAAGPQIYAVAHQSREPGYWEDRV